MKSFFTALMLLCMGSLYAQDCHSTLSGKVVDQHTGAPLISAKLQVLETGKTTYTDSRGHYVLKNLCNGQLDILITHDNAQEKALTVTVDGQTHADITLDHHPEELRAVVVVGSAIIRKSKTSQEQTISGADIDKFSSATLGDALKQMSGVSTLKTGKNIVKPVIQGLSGSRVPVINNGVRMADQEWGAEHAPNIDLNAAGKLTVVKGAAALQYGGDAIGGVVIVEKPDIPKKDTLYGKTILTGALNGRGGSVSTALTKSFASGWYIRAQGTYKKFGDYEAPDYVLSNTGINERDYSINIGLQKLHYGFDVYYSSFDSHLGILRASSTGSVADLVKAINSDRPIYSGEFSYELHAPKEKVHHKLARVKFYRHFDGLGKLKLSYSFQENDRLEYDIRKGDYKYIPSVDLNLKTHAATADFEFDTFKNYKINVGINGSYKDNFADPETGVKRIIPDYNSYDFGAYVLGNYTVNADWLVEAGVRYDYAHIDAMKYYNKNLWHNLGYDQDFSRLVIGDYGSQYLTNPVFDYSNVSATVGAKYDFAQHYTLRANYAMSNRAPNPSELFSDGLHHAAASLELGNLRLGSEHAHNVSLSLEKHQGDFTFTIAPYLNYIHNFIYTKPAGLRQTIRGVFLRYAYKQTDVRLLGVNIDVNYAINKAWSYQGKFSTVDGRKTATNTPLIGMPATHLYNGLTFQIPWHKLTLNVYTDAVFQKQHYPNNNFTIKVLENGVYHEKLVDISTPPEGYFLTGFDAGAVFHPFNHGALHVRLALDNIFNVTYRGYLNRLRYYAANMGRNISLQLKFTY